MGSVTLRFYCTSEVCMLYCPFADATRVLCPKFIEIGSGSGQKWQKSWKLHNRKGYVELLSVPAPFTLRLLLLAGINFSVLVVCCIWQVCTCIILAFFDEFLIDYK